MAAKVGKKPDIYSRLTDPKLYTGAHKARFDSDGKGRGLAGRDMGNEGKINDLAQLTRGGGKGTKAAASSPTRKPVVSSKPHVFGSTKVPEPLAKKPAAQSAAPAAAAAEAPAAAPAAASPTAAAGGAKRSKGDIVSRLTDTKLYTGAHKARFDSDGHGRGIAGRTDTQINDLSQLTRPGARKSVGGASPSKAAGTVSGVAPIHVQKFGTQAAVARKIHVFQNGDKFHKGVVVTMVKSITTMAKLLNELTSKLALTTGAAKKVYRVVGAGESFTAVNSLDAFEDGGLYLVCGPEQIDKAKLPAALTSK